MQCLEKRSFVVVKTTIKISINGKPKNDDPTRSIMVPAGGGKTGATYRKTGGQFHNDAMFLENKTNH